MDVGPLSEMVTGELVGGGAAAGDVLMVPSVRRCSGAVGLPGW